VGLASSNGRPRDGRVENRSARNVGRAKKRGDQRRWTMIPLTVKKAAGREAAKRVSPYISEPGEMSSAGSPPNVSRDPESRPWAGPGRPAGVDQQGRRPLGGRARTGKLDTKGRGVGRP